MIRNLQTHTNKVQSVMYTAAADMTRGAFVTPNESAMTVSAATADTIYMVDVPKNYDGINSMVDPSDGDFEDIKKGARVILVPVLPGERYATSEVTVGTATVGAAMGVSAGKLAAKTNGEWIYCGTYSDPTGIAMYIVKRA